MSIYSPSADDSVELSASISVEPEPYEAVILNTETSVTALEDITLEGDINYLHSCDPEDA